MNDAEKADVRKDDGLGRVRVFVTLKGAQAHEGIVPVVDPWGSKKDNLFRHSLLYYPKLGQEARAHLYYPLEK